MKLNTYYSSFIDQIVEDEDLEQVNYFWGNPKLTIKRLFNVNQAIAIINKLIARNEYEIVRLNEKINETAQLNEKINCFNSPSETKLEKDDIKRKQGEIREYKFMLNGLQAEKEFLEMILSFRGGW